MRTLNDEGRGLYDQRRSHDKSTRFFTTPRTVDGDIVLSSAERFYVYYYLPWLSNSRLNTLFT